MSYDERRTQDVKREKRRDHCLPILFLYCLFSCLPFHSASRRSNDRPKKRLLRLFSARYTCTHHLISDILRSMELIVHERSTNCYNCYLSLHDTARNTAQKRREGEEKRTHRQEFQCAMHHQDTLGYQEGKEEQSAWATLWVQITPRRAKKERLILIAEILRNEKIDREGDTNRICVSDSVRKRMFYGKNWERYGFPVFSSDGNTNIYSRYFCFPHEKHTHGEDWVMQWRSVCVYVYRCECNRCSSLVSTFSHCRWKSIPFCPVFSLSLTPSELLPVTLGMGHTEHKQKMWEQ